MTRPVFTGLSARPVGAQLIAQRNDDRKLFAAARWVYRQLVSSPERGTVGFVRLKGWPL